MKEMDPKRNISAPPESRSDGIVEMEPMDSRRERAIAGLKETLLDSIEEGYFEVDLAGNMVFFNESLRRITGYPREKLIGMNNRQYTSSENAKRMYEVFNSVYLTGKGVQIKDYEILKGDGSRCVLELSTSLILDTAGQPIGFRGIARDVTERKRMEADLRRSEENFKKLYDKSRRAEELYRSLLHSSADAIVICALDASIRYISPAFTDIFGWTLNEVKGQPLPFVREADREKVGGAIQEILRDGRHVRGFAVKALTRDRRLINIKISGSRYNDHEAAPAGMLLIIRDTTAERILEDQLLHSQKMEAIGTLAGGIAHDFNNLLMGIQGRTSLILMDDNLSKRAYEHLKGIEEYVQNAAHLTRQLLGFARSGKYEVTPANMNDLVNRSVGMFGRTKKEIDIHTSLQTDIWTVEVDQGQIEQALLNLYVNAWQAMPEGGMLTLRTQNRTLSEAFTSPHGLTAGRFVMIEVTDTGAGIDKQIQKRIFDPFFTTKEVGRGTGLGLSSVYGIIKNHNGIIDVFSNKGEGTTFTIYLPACEGTAARQRASAGSVLAGSETILLVDDEEMIVEIGAQILKKLGYRVLPARGGREALRIYREKHAVIDLVILDMIMPVMSGKETCEALKALNPTVRILLSSGYSMKEQTGRMLNGGCDGFIQKPFSVVALSRKVREILDRQEGEMPKMS